MYRAVKTSKVLFRNQEIQIEVPPWGPWGGLHRDPSDLVTVRGRRDLGVGCTVGTDRTTSTRPSHCQDSWRSTCSRSHHDQSAKKVRSRTRRRITCTWTAYRAKLAISTRPVARMVLQNPCNSIKTRLRNEALPRLISPCLRWPSLHQSWSHLNSLSSLES